MTNETNRTKTKVSGIGMRGIAIVLCFVMLLTAIGSGSVLSAIAVEGNGASVLLDAAKAGASVDVAADVAAADDKAAADEDEATLTKKADSDLADTGRDADVASTGASMTVYYRNNHGWSNVYILNSSTINMTSGDNGWSDVYGSNMNDSGSNYIQMTLVPGETNVYQATLNITSGKVVFVSKKGNTAGYLNNATNCVARADYASGKVVNAWSNDNDKLTYQNNTQYWKSSLEDYTPPADSIRDRKGKTNSFYLTGAFNNWAKTSSSWQLTKVNDNEWSGTFTISGSSSYEFKIYCSQDTKEYSIQDTNGYNFTSSWDGSEASTMYIATDQNKMKITTPGTGKYVINVHLWLQYGDNSKLTVSQKAVPQIKGDSFGGTNWSLKDMTYDSEGNIFKYTYTPSASGDFYFSFYNPNDSKYYGPNDGNYNFTNQTTGYGCNNNDSNRFYVNGLKGATYTIKYNVATNSAWLVATIPDPTDFYLTGYVNGTDYSGTDYHFLGSGDNYTYTLASNKASQYLTITDNLGQTYHPGTHPAANGAVYTTTDSSPTADKKWGITSGASGKNITFTWKPNSKTLSWTISSGGTIDVFAKDGAAPINWKDKTNPGATGLAGTTVDGKQEYYYNYGIIGTTTATCSDATFTRTDCAISGVSSSGSTYQYGSVPVGKAITVTTTISSTYSSKYYVAGWSVNGITYKNGTDTVGVNPSTTTSYSFTYTLPSDTEGMLKDKAGNPVVEITPIYYLKSKTDTVTFYLEGYSDVASKWGNTPYCYPFYGNLNGYQSTFGVYPGQPMVNVGGQISIEIPIYTKPISGSVATTVIKGVTVSNGYADHVHRNLVYGWSTAAGDVNNDVDHMQTYDYDDFHKIWAERIVSGQHPNAIFFRIKEETNKYNRSTYGGGSTSGQFASGTSNIDIAAIASSGNGWELMKDRHDRNVNIFGDYNAVKSVTPGASAAADKTKAIYVVSTGYNANIAGDYGTMWKIYNGSGQLISNAGGRVGIPPSLLNLAGNASSGMTSTVTYPSANHSVSGVGSYTDANSNYNAIYKALKASTYNNKLVYITYEKDTQDTRNTATGEGAYRVDGKWFYTHASDTVKSTIGIEYYDRATGTWKTDTISNAGLGTTTKATAAFDSGSYTDSNKITSKDCLISDDITLNFTATESGTDNKYAFSGWYLKYDDTYEHVTGSTTTGSIKATANYSLIARYVPVVTNSLVITHKLDPESTGTGTATMTVKYNNTTQTVNYINGVANAEINVSWATAAKNIDVTLTATPQNDGRVDSISVDDQIRPYADNSTDYDLPCNTDGRVVTRTLRFTDHDVYNSAGTSLVISQLDYVSKISATPHYYEFTYTFTARDKTTKTYTARGEISEDHYSEYVNSSHEVSDAFVKSRAPFESNFLQTLKLDTISGKDYDTSTHTLSATATYNATPYTPVYDVKIKLPYNYRTEDATESGVKYKKYNANGSDYNENQAPFTLKANYDEFVTIDATETTAGAQTNVSKVVDVAADPNHTGNDFITAPNTLVSSGTTMYFRYWEIKRLADNDKDQAAAPLISRIYYPDLNYRFYADSYVEAVYTPNEAEYWSNVYKNHANTELSCSVLYLESSRNQWNMNGSNTTNTSSTVAADKIYNDFIFSYRLCDEEYIPASKAEIGMILERVYTNKNGTKAWVEGDSSITDMDSYKADNSVTEDKDAIINGLKSGGTLPNNCFKQVWNNRELNNKNYTEQNTAVYSQFGQKVDTHSITFNSDSANDNYVYRAWAYIKDKSTGNVAVSDPAYFSMNFVASQNYSE